MEEMEMSPDFWKDKCVLVTGHTGFKGSWLCLWLQEMGVNVIGYALEPPSTPSMFEVASVGDGMTSIIADIRNCERLRETIAKYQPEIAIHMAAQPLVRASYDDPVDTYATNIMGTVHLLDAVRQIGGVRVVINVTSDKCYDNREWHWGYRENEPMGGYDPYSSSKGCAELVTSAYRSSFFNHATYDQHGTALASVRAGNVIGGGDWGKCRLIPDIVSAFSTLQPVVIRSPHAIRPWQHVLEPLHGYLLLAEKLWVDGPHYAEGWNFGPDDKDAKPVRWIVEYLANHWGDDVRWTHDETPSMHEATYLKLDCSKAHARINWNPVWGISRSLDEIIFWYQSFALGKDMKSISRNQIRNYIQEYSK